MKKFLSVLLALVMVLSATSAFAELSYYMAVGVVDAEGNIAVMNEDSPVLVFGIDDDENNQVCAFGDQDNAVEGTYELIMLEDTDEAVLVKVTLATGEELTLIYSLVDDVFMYETEEGVTVVMMNLEQLQAEAEAA